MTIPFEAIEFLGLPGSGKTILTDAVGQRWARAHILRGEALGDDLPALRRHLRRALHVVPRLITHPRLMWGVFQRVRASRQGSVHALLKTCWNFWTVIGLTLSARARRTSLVSDQGIIQAVWSVGLSAGRDVDDWWEFLARHEMLPDILIVVHCPPETAAMRLNQRRVGTSRLTGIGAEDARWARASELMAGLINEARQRIPVIEVQNDGTRAIEALAADVSRQMAEHLEAAPHAD